MTYSEKACYVNSILRSAGPYSTQKGYIFWEKETSLRKCIYGMFILSIIQERLSRRGHK